MPAKNDTVDEVRSVLAANVKRLRKSKALAEGRRLSQETVAHEAGIDRTMMSKIETSKTNPSLETLLKLANYFGVEVSDLLAS